MKKILTLFCMIFFLSVGVIDIVQASDHSTYVSDIANLLTAEEEQALIDKSKEIDEKFNFDAVILTVPDLEGVTAESYARDYYENGNYCDDGILFFLSMEERDWRIETFGSGDVFFTDYGLDYLEENVLSDLSNGDYNESFTNYINLTNDYVKEALDDSPFDTNNKFLNKNKTMLIATILAALFASIIVGIMASQMSTKKPEDLAHQYVNRDDFDITERKDVFLYRTLTKTPRPKSNSSSGSGGGRSSGGRGGKF